MYLNDAATAAVVVSCLLLMFSYQPVMACNCPDISDIESFCSAENIVRLKVLKEIEPEPEPESEFEDEDEKPSSDYYHYKVRIEHVYKSSKGLTPQAEVDFRTPKVAELCYLNLYTGKQYLLDVQDYNGDLSANACSWIKRWERAQEYVKILSDGTLQSACRQDRNHA
ncbi:hypothetical protein CHS0354_007945 [Potamilus streckersoni]|uniref:NTR domain-containing protein n=1 Tax=Potamilus streckersoni TaxID=2493646 RepID=A0AAE0S8Z1_9BIVA|nr:hypothetical protein CHS0354_007945 [Potamilus streckersoni]